MNIKTLLLPPLIPVALLLLLCAWVLLDGVAIIDGRPDNAPTRASAIIAILSPIFYLIFAVFNLIDLIVSRVVRASANVTTGALILGFGIILAIMFYAPEVDSTPFYAIAVGFGLAFMIFAPMSVVRSYLLARDRISKKPNKSDQATLRKPSD